MSSSKERVFVTAATGNIGSGVVRGLIKRGIDTTAYIRDEQKAKDLFKDELNTGHLTVVVGTYSSVDIFTKAIQGHTRLFLLFAASGTRPASMSEIKGTFAKIAFEQGVRQIVDISSAFVSSYGRKGIIGYMHFAAEEKLWTLADENSEERSLVVLRPGSFMSNHFMGDVHHIKDSNKIVSCGLPSSTMTWIDTKDISDCAVIVLSESVEKHDRNVYEMGSETLSNEQRAAVFTKVLGKPIIYEQQSMEDFYKTHISFGMSHSFVYNFALASSKNICETTTPEIALIIGRPLRTLEHWVRENIKSFE
ncbi:unnamed protein product [Rotaria magnacalcarata]|uniref:NmrA-like domain-containing protein n=1 Tax=Rotaria magnacalcarata TaxID=392030 RepID=A0A816TS16_9BILA|nr:unnamed protein product [Rotaria magnacalcarata]CAF1612077.1 unnamed protein product [Rotaria magnacalcarata]CAF2103058.1 unnamed protein product [Rotaria magnacalcarata]CAF2107324.1 unnamed protein product [Rotaria magnacalcarata]CAF2224663.1 unnamed protein product [Rotaria magnacalcarata]